MAAYSPAPPVNVCVSCFRLLLFLTAKETFFCHTETMKKGKMKNKSLWEVCYPAGVCC